MPKRQADDEDPPPQRSSRVRKVSEKMAESIEQSKDGSIFEDASPRVGKVSRPLSLENGNQEWYVLVESRPTNAHGTLPSREFWSQFITKEEGPFESKLDAAIAAKDLVASGHCSDWFDEADPKLIARWERDCVWDSSEMDGADNDTEKRVLVLDGKAFEKRMGEIEANRAKARAPKA